MARAIRFCLLALAVLFAQHAAQLHAVSHLAGGGGKPTLAGSPAGTAQAQCLALDTLGCALSGRAGAAGVTRPSSVASFRAAPGTPRAAPIDLRSQSPPCS